MQKCFSFRGIVRNTDNLLAREGECMELVNMRVNNGSLQPVALPDVFASFQQRYTAVYIHSIANVYFFITEGDARVHLYDNDFRPLSTALMISGSPLLSLDAIGILRVEFVGNIACLFTAEKLLYAIYDAGRYKWLGEAPAIPKLSFTTKSIAHEINTDNEYYPTSLNSSISPETRWENCSKGYFDEALSKLNTQGYFVDRALFRYAFRLFDGSYICASPIYYVEDKNEVDGLYRDRGNFYSHSLSATPGTSNASKYSVKVQGFKPEFLFDGLNIASWENIIVSLDVFTSGSILGHKVLNSSEVVSSRGDNVYTSSSVGYERYAFKPYSEIWREVAECSIFYKVAEYKLDGSLSDYESDVSAVALSQCDTMPLDCGSLRMVSADYSYVFNGRLHLAALREKHYSGYGSDCFLPASLSAKSTSAKVYTELKTESGSVVVKKVHNNFLLGESSGNYYITPFVLYPDSRARSMTFVIFLNSKYYRKTFNLTPHKMLDASYYLNCKVGNLSLSVDISGSSATAVRILSQDNVYSFFAYEKGEYKLVYSDTTGWMYGDRCFAAPGATAANSSYPTIFWQGEVKNGDVTIVKIVQSQSDDPIGALCDITVDSTWDILDSEPLIEENNISDVRSNVMRVSSVDNPFSFPVAQTYKPSNGTIYALCSNTVALSQGQFGQHPLYLFCSDGIWVMSVDTSGTVAYTAAYPLSREVCNNPSSVRGIDSGVVFISDKGLMLVQGSNVRNLSAAMLSEHNSMKDIASGAIFKKISAIASLDNMFVNDNFLIYLSGALLGYNYLRNEIVVTNKGYSYSYIFSLESGEWYKISITFDFIGKSYPYFLGLTLENGVSSLYRFYDKREADTPVLLFSRPLLWGGKFFKRVLQSMLHAVIKPAKGNNLFNGLACYLLCSNDGVNYKLVTGSEIREEHNDIHFPYMPTASHRYFVIALVGNLSTTSKITAVEMFVDSAWNNRIR